MSSDIGNNDQDEIENIKMKTLHEMQKQVKIQQAHTEALKALGGKPIDLADSNFFSEVSKYPLMLIDFWAPWCGPCRMVSPTVDQLAKQYSDKIAFGRVNVDENPMTASQFGIQGIPTLLIFQHGKAVDGLVGAYPKNMIESRLKAHLGNSSTTGAYQ
ncbi:MAG: thioredoxin [Nitrososphaerota archaeon]|nr:thioredoxin [Nitrososphaerota archaeon]